MTKALTFQADAEHKAFDREHRRKIRFNIGKYDAAVSAGLHHYQDHELARSRGAFVKAQVLEKLDEYLLQFEQAFTARGGRVVWARDAQEALAEIGRLTQARAARTVVKAKSMTTEEIHVNAYLQSRHIESVETDLGEYIVQLNGERPYHIVTPAMHLSKADINDIFVKHLGTESTDDAQQLVLTARHLLRDKYTSAEVGITGGNFLLAKEGAVAVTENEGNARPRPPFPTCTSPWWALKKSSPRWLIWSCSGRCSARAAPASSSRFTTRFISGRASRAKWTAPVRWSSSCSTTGARTYSPSPTAARRCAAFVAGPASTCARSIKTSAGTPTKRRTPGRLARLSVRT